MASTSSSTSSSSAEASAALNISSALYRASFRRTYSATPGTSSASALIRSLSGQKPATSLISSCPSHTRRQAGGKERLKVVSKVRMRLDTRPAQRFHCVRARAHCVKL